MLDFAGIFVNTVICLIEPLSAIARLNLIPWSRSWDSELSNGGLGFVAIIKNLLLGLKRITLIATLCSASHFRDSNYYKKKGKNLRLIDEHLPIRTTFVYVGFYFYLFYTALNDIHRITLIPKCSVNIQKPALKNDVIILIAKLSKATMSNNNLSQFL